MPMTNIHYLQLACGYCGDPHSFDGIHPAYYRVRGDLGTNVVQQLRYEGWNIIDGQLWCWECHDDPQARGISIRALRRLLRPVQSYLAVCDGADCNIAARASNEYSDRPFPLVTSTPTTTGRYAEQLAEVGWEVAPRTRRHWGWTWCQRCRPNPAATLGCQHPAHQTCPACVLCRACTNGQCACALSPLDRPFVHPKQNALF